MSTEPTKAPTHYSPIEEWGHSLSHGAGFIASIVALVVMLQASGDDPWRIASSLVFGISMCLLYASSTIYHAVPPGPWKLWLRKVDHSAIFLLIAGTYTPFTLISLRDDGGWWLFGIVWAIALAGVILKIFTGAKFQKLSIALYLMMGWLVVTMGETMLRLVPHEGLWWLLAGGLCYSGGVVFYVQKKLFFHHVIWHLFVLAGSICHFLAIYWYVL
ncbi:MAG TPA: hemolysin III [Rheinheimera sp.]|nr:hemolysin III [Rheinheimera sp.]